MNLTQLKIDLLKVNSVILCYLTPRTSNELDFVDEKGKPKVYNIISSPESNFIIIDRVNIIHVSVKFNRFCILSGISRSILK